ncbi:ABC transporter ATP-binding protein [Psychroserpens ponticola]|uniref:ABC transporter transmembrane domain-containing protein n=1 Tax=Psychroserpens ponticola TaxID=2932268 RepID=A0ABY7RU50_9FLAO|nr:ABC transporter transmembrane domain-containing protein [Psychroserpens ponticola]WCO00641.1 ABC transporter transmembrane domain-containing protein [Psychroserpens ponticola]
MDQNLKKIIPYAIRYKSNIVWNVIFNILYALFSTLSFITMFPLLEVLFKKGEDLEAKVTTKPVYTDIWNIVDYLKDSFYYNISSLEKLNGPQYALLLAVGLVIITFLLKNLFNFLASYHILHLQNGVLRDLRSKMFDKIISLPIPFYSKRSKGDIMARMLGDIGEVKRSFFLILELVVREPLTILFAIIAMLKISLELTLFVFIFIPISGFIISRIGKNLKSKSTRLQQESGKLISIVEESLTGLKVVKSYNAESNFKQRFSKSINKILKLSNSIGNKNNLASPMSEFMGIVTIAALLWYGGNLVLVEKTLDGELFLVYLMLAYNILTPAKAISKASYSVKNGLAAAERVFEILEQEDSIPTKKDAMIKQGFTSGISIKNINFRYQEVDVLKHFSIEVPKGKTIALVGQSGSGKSTIANLLTRFYDVNEGRIEIDGINIKDMEIHSLRDLMGLVTQDSILFNDSVRNNILIGKEDASDEDIIEALKIANAWEFVKDLTNGLDTNIGDSGGNLSGGQKQRLSIARAVLKNPPIMILDEATSALDTESERIVQEALENMMKNRTSIVIAHRLSTIQNADEIIVMQKGEIAEQGTHNELIAKNGVYKKLVDMQSFE